MLIQANCFRPWAQQSERVITLQLQSCEEQFTFIEKNYLMDEHLPIEFKVIEEKDKPCVTDQYKQLLPRRQASFLSNDMPTYHKLRNKANRKSKS